MWGSSVVERLLLPLLLLASLATSISFAQSPGEVRIRSEPYVFRPAFRTESRLVQLEIVVRDTKGRPIAGLQKNDFIVLDSGTRRDLTAFSVQSSSASRSSIMKRAVSPEETASRANAPSREQNHAAGRSLLLFFDDTNTYPGDLAHAKLGARRFVKEAVEEGDRLAVFSTSAGKVLDFSGDAPKILATIAAVQSHPRMSPGGLAPCPRITPYEAYRILNNDAMAMQAKVEEACHCAGGPTCDVSNLRPDELLNPTSRTVNNYYTSGPPLSSLIDAVKTQADQTWNQARIVSEVTLDGIRKAIEELAQSPGTRILLLASAGFLSGTLEYEEDQIINRAVEMRVVINSLDAKGLYAESPTRPLTELSEMTEVPIATLVYEARTLGERLDSVDAVLAKFAESTGGLFFRNNNNLDLGFYELGVAPEVSYLLAFSPAEDGKYHKVTVEFTTPHQYLVQARPGYLAPSRNANQQNGESIDREVGRTEAVHRLRATTRVRVVPPSKPDQPITIETTLDPQALPFQQQQDRRVEKLTFIAALFTGDGAFVTGKRAQMDLALKPDTFQKIAKTGMKTSMTLNAASGTYRLRIIVQEGVRGNTDAETQEVRIP